MNKISKATLRRYPVYLKALRKLKSSGISHIMSSELSQYVAIKPTTIRRDFSLLGNMGKQGYGYDIDLLIKTFSEHLGVSYDEKIILVGAGHFGHAILNYNHWDNVVGEIVCAFDAHPEKCQSTSVPLYHLSELRDKIPDGCRIAIVCISSDIQNTIDYLIDCGIKGIVDFTHEHFVVPEGIHIRNVDVVSIIQELVFETNIVKKGEVLC